MNHTQCLLFVYTHSIAVTTEGKKCLIDGGAKKKLCPLLYDDNSEVKLNAIKVATAS